MFKPTVVRSSDATPPVVDVPAQPAGGANSQEVVALRSPSLDKYARGGPSAKEMKFLLEESQARELERLLAPFLSLDPHADPKSRGYSLTTLYCDTPEFDVFHRRGRFRLFKFRLRRYGDGSSIYLERKSKRGLVVRKRRTSVAIDDIVRLENRKVAEDWQGSWFHSQLLRSCFLPACLLRYDRTAYFAPGEDGPVRLTFDRQIRGAIATSWSMEAPPATQPLLTSKVVCELKFRGDLPALFKAAIAELQLASGGVSKYRHCLSVVGAEVSGGLKRA